MISSSTVCETSRWVITVGIVVIFAWLAHLIKDATTMKSRAKNAAYSLLILAILEKIIELCLRDQFYISDEDYPNADVCYLYAQIGYGMTQPLLLHVSTFLARCSIRGAPASKSRHIGGFIWASAAFFVIWLPIENDLFLPPAVPGLCVASMISGLVAFSNTLIFALRLYNLSRKIPVKNIEGHQRHFVLLSMLMLACGLISITEAI